MHIARGDIATAVRNLMDRGERYGESKWASLQAAEKVLKAAIDLQGAHYEFIHGLEKLCANLKSAGIDVDLQRSIDAIQCKPGIRYGEEECSRDQALAAHRESLRLVGLVREAGAKFNTGLG